METTLSAWKPVNLPRSATNSRPRNQRSRQAAARKEHGHSDMNDMDHGTPSIVPGKRRVQVEISRPSDFDKDEYDDLTSLAYNVAQILSEKGGLYQVLFEDGRQDTVSAYPLYGHQSWSIQGFTTSGSDTTCRAFQSVYDSSYSSSSSYFITSLLHSALSALSQIYINTSRLPQDSLCTPHFFILPRSSF